MRSATVVAGMVVLGLAQGGCKKDGNARCRVFEQDPQQVRNEDTLAEIRQAYQDTQRIAECAQAARVTVEQFMQQHRVRERLDWVRVQLGEAGETVIEGAHRTIREVKEGAQRAVDQAERLRDEAIRAAQDLAP